MSEATDQTMTISEMCAAYDVTPRTLRFYEAKELLFPIRQGTRRHFTKRDRARLKLILRGKRFGFSLEEMRQLLDLYDVPDNQKTQLEASVRVGRGHLSAMQEQRQELDGAIADLEKQLRWAEGVLAQKTTETEAA